MNFTCPHNSTTGLNLKVCSHLQRHLFARGLCNNTRKQESEPAHSLEADVRVIFPTIIRGNYRHGAQSVHVKIHGALVINQRSEPSGRQEKRN